MKQQTGNQEILLSVNPRFCSHSFSIKEPSNELEAFCSNLKAPSKAGLGGKLPDQLPPLLGQSSPDNKNYLWPFAGTHPKPREKEISIDPYLFSQPNSECLKSFYFGKTRYGKTASLLIN